MPTKKFSKTTSTIWNQSKFQWLKLKISPEKKRMKTSRLKSAQALLQLALSSTALLMASLSLPAFTVSKTEPFSNSYLTFCFAASFLIQEKTSKPCSLGFIIFLAILLHKCPASVGLGSYLRGQGESTRNSIKSVLSFTLSSPISCIVFYFMLCCIPESNEFNLPLVLAVLLLISAGTFLYVATMHILPETLAANKDQTLTCGEILFLSLSMMLPQIIKEMGELAE